MRQADADRELNLKSHQVIKYLTIFFPLNEIEPEAVLLK